MLNDLTFKDVCKFLKKEDGGALIDRVDQLLGAALLLSPAVVGVGPLPALALPALSLISGKNELTKLAKSLYDKLTSKQEADYVARMKRMETAYGLICFTAFFEALDQTLPDDLRKAIAIIPQEKKDIVHPVRQTASSDEDRGILEAHTEGVLADVPLPFPHPVVPFEEHKEHLSRFYREMAQGVSNFIEKLAVWEKADEKAAARIRKAIDTLPAASLKYFEAQYVELARRYPDFYIWSHLYEHRATQRNLKICRATYMAILHKAEKQLTSGLVNCRKQ